MRWLIEGDSEMDLDLPAGDFDPLHDEAEKLLPPGEVQVIDAGCHRRGEVLHSGS